MSEIKINKLASRTWNRLGVNEARIEWDEKNTVSLGDESVCAKSGEEPKTVRFSVSDNGGYSSRNIFVDAEKDSSVTVFEICTAKAPLCVNVKVTARENASVRLIQLINPSEGAVLRHETSADCAENAKFEIISVLIGDGDIYSDNHIGLIGDGSSLSAETAYLGESGRTIDCNITSEHYGRSTKSEINASGALRDFAKKIFRGTIDFKKGSADSVGSENETVLMLGDDAVNKTVPLILCAEENVEGTHGATIGELDDETLFYFESRGIGREEAERIMAYAAVRRLMRMSGDEIFAGRVSAALGLKAENEE